MSQSRTAAWFCLALLLCMGSPAQAQVKVITSGGFEAPYRALLPEFQRITGIAVSTETGASQGEGPSTIPSRLLRGETADVVIMSREGLNDLIAHARIVTGSDVDLAETPLGVAVRTGMPKPKMDTVDGFIQMLVAAKSIALNSTTGIYLTKTLFPRLGIAEKLAPKITFSGVAAVASGEAELAIQPVSELLRRPGLEFVAPLPRELQYVAVFSAAVLAGSRQAEAARRLIAFLASDAAAPALNAYGMQPPTRH
jgi:molybdate transport system substrate-binding protein